MLSQFIICKRVCRFIICKRTAPFSWGDSREILSVTSYFEEKKMNGSHCLSLLLGRAAAVWLLSAIRLKLGDSPANLIKSTKVLIATQQGSEHRLFLALRLCPQDRPGGQPALRAPGDSDASARAVTFCTLLHSGTSYQSLHTIGVRVSHWTPADSDFPPGRRTPSLGHGRAASHGGS